MSPELCKQNPPVPSLKIISTPPQACGRLDEMWVNHLKWKELNFKNKIDWQLAIGICAIDRNTNRIDFFEKQTQHNMTFPLVHRDSVWLNCVIQFPDRFNSQITGRRHSMVYMCFFQSFLTGGLLEGKERGLLEAGRLINFHILSIQVTAR